MAQVSTDGGVEVGYEASATGHLAFDETKIEGMKTAINTYQTNINNVLDQISNYSISGENGIYGAEQIATISQYVDDTCSAINSIIIMFDEFKSKLENVKQAYDAQQKGITTNDVVKASSASEEDLVTVKAFE